jgi:hypothetical protein
VLSHSIALQEVGDYGHMMTALKPTVPVVFDIVLMDFDALWAEVMVMQADWSTHGGDL